jgi:hypothetical protein
MKGSKSRCVESPIAWKENMRLVENSHNIIKDHKIHLPK